MAKSKDEMGILEAITVLAGHHHETPHSPPELKEALRVSNKFCDEVDSLLKEDWIAEDYNRQARLIIGFTDHLGSKHAVGALLTAVAITLIAEGEEDKLEAAVALLRNAFRDVAGYMGGRKT